MHCLPPSRYETLLTNDSRLVYNSYKYMCWVGCQDLALTVWASASGTHLSKTRDENTWVNWLSCRGCSVDKAVPDEHWS